MSEDDYGSPEPLQAAGDPALSSSGRHHTPNHRKGPRFSWTPAYETTFFRSLCESVNLGLKDNHSFKSEAWDRACEALAERHQAYPNKGHLINKSDNARKKFRLWRGLREDPEFLYNPKSKTVTATEEAWRAHIQKEPLSKSLRNRPFEHEHFMEILFPDVVGSGGAPKRITKTRRKGFDLMQDAEDLDCPGTSVMDLLSPGEGSMLLPSTTQTPIQPPTVPSNGTIRPASTMQNRASDASSTALTPPDDEPAASNSHPRKRRGQSNATPGSGKRRRTGNNNYIDLTHQPPMMNMNSQMQDVGNMIPNNYNQDGPQANEAGHANVDPVGASRSQLAEEAMVVCGDFLRNYTNASPPRWVEMAMEIFFREFGEEDADLQIKIGEKVLCDTNKSTMFCMMPPTLRQHWVKRLRELHNRMDVSLTSNMTGTQAAAVSGNNGLVTGGSIGSMAGMIQVGGPVNGTGIGRNGSQVG